MTVVNEELRREVRWDRKNVVDTRGGARYTHTHFHGRLMYNAHRHEYETPRFVHSQVHVGLPVWRICLTNNIHMLCQHAIRDI